MITTAEQAAESEVQIAEFQPRFSAGIIDLILPIQQQEFGIQVSKDDQPDLLAIDKFYCEPGGNFWIARAGERIVGSIGLLNIGNGQGALRKMFVAREYRGQRRGVAQQLLEILLAWGSSQGMGEIYLGTTDKFLAAHRFYEKNGFSRLDNEALPAAFPRMAVDSIFYQRKL